MEDHLPAEFWQGVDQFNQGEFYACHDTFEALWTEALEPDRTFYQGLLQIAVALYHLSNHNWRGAVTLTGEAVGRLRKYDEDYGGIDLAALLAQARLLLQRLQQIEPEAVGELADQLGLGSPRERDLGSPRERDLGSPREPAVGEVAGAIGFAKSPRSASPPGVTVPRIYPLSPPL